MLHIWDYTMLYNVNKVKQPAGTPDSCVLTASVLSGLPSERKR